LAGWDGKVLANEGTPFIPEGFSVWELPVPTRPGQGERDALLEAGRRMQGELARLGLTEEELVADLRRWRKARGAK